ncbi:hypothetical protein MSG28_002595, partial [Choristoneura fumiferana]
MFFERTYQAHIIQEELERSANTHHNQSKETGIVRLLRNKAIAYLVVFLETSSIHGLNHLVATGRHVFEILLWLTMVILSVFGSVYLSQTTWFRYQSSPTVVSMDRDMFAWNTTFPCVTICPHTRFDEKKLDVFVKTSTVENKTALESFIRKLANFTYRNFEDLPDSDLIDPNEYLKILVSLAAPFGPTLTIGASGINLKIQPTITEMGLCYAVNSKVAEYNSPAYRDANRWDDIKLQNDTFFVHPLDGEVFAQVINLSTAYDHNAVYTYTMCRMECRIRLCLKYCGCIPYFYRRIGDETICGVSGMRCLAEYKGQLYKLESGKNKKISCGCFPICDDVNYVIQSSVLQPWFLGTNLQWGIVTYPRMRYRRDIIFGFTDVLVAVGSMAGLFLGCSVLSF